MESEINFIPYIVAVLRRWRMILIFMIGFSAVGAGISLRHVDMNSATATLLFVPGTYQLSFDTDFKPINAGPVAFNSAQQRGLADLAISDTIRQEVAQLLDPDNPAPSLSNSVTVGFANEQMKITVSDPDPLRAEEVADAWGKVCERLLIEMYYKEEFQSDYINTEIEGAEERYAEAQAALEAFIGDDQLVKTEYQITQIEGLLQGAIAAQQLLYSDYLNHTRELSQPATQQEALQAQATLLTTAISEANAVASKFDTANQQPYISQLVALQSRAEQLRAQQNRLTLERDRALETLLTLRGMREMQHVLQGFPEVEIQFINAIPNPLPSTKMRFALNIGVGTILGLAFGIVIALILDVLIPAIRRITVTAK